MRIAVLTNDYPREEGSGLQIRGGAGRIAALQVQILKQAGHEVRVWHVPCTWQTKTPWHRFLAHVHDRKARPELVSEILAWQPDTLLTHNLTGCGFGTPKAIQAHGIYWVHVLHDVQLFEPSGRIMTVLDVTLWQMFWMWIRRHALGNPRVVLSPTNWLLRKHRRREFFLSTHTYCEVLPHPSEPYHLTVRDIHHPFRFLFVAGSVSREKGSEFLARLLRRVRIPYELRVVGEGPGCADLQSLGDHVFFYRQLSSEEIKKLMEESDVLLVPSLIEENQPNVILEAASCGLPVIASDKGGIVETMGHSGIICPAGHLESWLRAIDDLQRDTTYKHVSETMEAIAHAHDFETYRQKFLSFVTSKR